LAREVDIAANPSGKQYPAARRRQLALDRAGHRPDSFEESPMFTRWLGIAAFRQAIRWINRKRGSS
jgi:hypothetical protein